MTDKPVAVFDGHNDVLLRLSRAPHPAPERLFVEGDGEGHMDLPRAVAGGLAGGLFAVYVPSPANLDDVDALMRRAEYDVPLPEMIPESEALPVTLAMSSLLMRIAAASEDRVRICRTSDDIRQCLARGVLAAVLHIEGAEAIGPGLEALDVLHAAGLRSLGPVWSRPTIFGHGVPFRYPSGPDTGPGLTGAGRDLVRACNRLGIVIDLSHITEAGFWDVAAITDAPLVASHSNAHAVTPHARNLTDRQLDAIAESGGLVGLNYAAAFLRPDGRMIAETGFDAMMRHLDHLLSRLGEDGVALGSDFDGATIPGVLGDSAGLPRLVAAMRDHGFGEALIARICHANWISVLERSWRGG